MLSDALHVVTQTGGTSVTSVLPALVDFSKELVSVLPVVVPVVLTMLALRKGIKFLFGTLRGV